MTYQTLKPALLNKLTDLAQQTGETLDALVERALNQLDETQPSRPLLLKPAPKTPPPEIFAVITDAVITIDADDNVVYVNPSTTQMFGYEAAELIGQSLAILLPDNIRQIHAQYVDDFKAGAATQRLMTDRRAVRAKRRDGSTFPVEISLTKYTSGGQLYCTAIIRDVGELEILLTHLYESEKLLYLLTENITDMLCLHAPDGKFAYVSPAALKLGGYNPSDLIGKNPYEFFHPDDVATVQTNHINLLNGQFSESVVYRWRCKDGSYLWLETTTTPIFDDIGSIKHLVTVSRDITKRREIERALHHERDLLHNITDLSPSGIVVVDNQGKIVYANQRAEAILGIAKQDITTRAYNAPTWKHTDYEGNPWLDEQQPFVRVMQTKQPVWDVRHAIEWSDGRRVFLAINGAPILDEAGEVRQVVFSVEDYTERKLQQDALEAMLAREKKLNELKTEFISMVSHEFRTPMSIIMTSTGILRMKYPNLTPDDFIKRVSKIDMQIMRLNDMIKDITFINRENVIGHTLQPIPIDLPQFFEQLSDELTMTFPQHQPIRIVEVRPSNPVLLDLAMMQHIFTNLLGNAVKYSLFTDTVICQYDCDGHELRVLIQDEGIGIPQEDQVHLFEVFHRARNVGTIPGTGLGLAIVKRAVNALNGTITFESSEGVGTKVMVTLPII